MKLTYYGHSCFSVKIKQKILLFDPFITGNELAGHIDISKITADYILLSHGHSDHTADAVAIAQATLATVVGAFEVAMWMRDQGVTQFHPMNTGGKWTFDFGTVKCTHAVHSSSMPDGSYGGSPMGFIITAEEGTFYYSGDTALCLDMQWFRSSGPFRFVILPIGDNFTMGVEDAVQAAKWLGAEKVVGVHYDTFGYIKIDKGAAVAAFQKEGIDLLLPGIGESIEL
ncbi:MAG TPA: metal-dependent hydrolase [Saprospiraceae bacterium]|nr:metal-dependent hydrolase [Saprospiraceae bacterium]HNT20684.1 metal-dependent hydrolase [Saprospiraceae bacterium]